MNDEIKKLIREILGDFPEGFNAGVVAGVPGWAGDIGYLLQEYPRALLTDTPLRPPVEYAGTTDAIAKAAGYEIPGTLSGQLGAAVGGLLSPGPGDLAKFAPLLGAIPFWHGSPHKFDAFDLSKMGTGEGAQAYGWGAYGADVPETAKSYIAAGGTASNSPELYAADVVAMFGGPEKALSHLRHISPPVGKTTYTGESHEFIADVIKAVESESYKNDGNLYRGEYAWPDPAKEAATPLTGEDLLQWDKPLSEQSPAVRVALTRLARENPGFMAQLERHGMGQVRGDVAYSALQENAARDEKYRRILAGESAPFSLDHSGSQRIASETLREYGIPGIRYLDGMSRDGGSGTYNYVMFDDKGIKLLERNGKPIRGLLNP